MRRCLIHIFHLGLLCLAPLAWAEDPPLSKNIAVGVARLPFSAAPPASGLEPLAPTSAASSEPTVPEDSQRPVQKVTTKGGGTVYDSTFVVRGRAVDNQDIGEVTLSLNALSTYTATLTGEGASRDFEFADLHLENGLNLMRIRTLDLQGNISESTTLKVTYVNQRSELAGTYVGLLLSTPERHHELTGSFRVEVTRGGRFTGKVQVDGVVLPFRGVINNAGEARFIYDPQRPPSWNDYGELSSKVKGGTITYSHLRFAFANGQLSGSFDQGRDASQLTASKAFFDGKSPETTVPPALLEGQGRYTFILPAPAVPAGYEDAGYPIGHGVGTLKLSRSGTVKVVGRLADGEPFAAAAPLSQSHTWPLFANLYKGGGALAGWVGFDLEAAESDLFSDSLVWICKSRPQSSPYQSFWSGLRLDLLGSKFSATRPGSIFPGLQTPEATSGNALLHFQDGFAEWTLPLHICSSNAVQSVPPGRSIQISIDNVTGLITGQPIPETQVDSSWKAVVYQKGAFAGAYGWYLFHPTAARFLQGGSVVITPRPQAAE